MEESAALTDGGEGQLAAGVGAAYGYAHRFAEDELSADGSTSREQTRRWRTRLGNQENPVQRAAARPGIKNQENHAVTRGAAAGGGNPL